MRTFKCGPVSCNCGIAAREGDDVLIVDMCRDYVPRVSFPSKKKVLPNNSTRMRRDSTGRNFLVKIIPFLFVKLNAFDTFVAKR